MPLKVYNRVRGVCWISSVPSDCVSDESVTCERGEYAGNIFLIGSIYFLCGFIIMVSAMYLVYAAVLRTERATDKYIIPYINNSDASNNEKHVLAMKKNRKISRKVAKQCLCFVGAWFLTFGFLALWAIIVLAGINIEGFWGDIIGICMVTTVPLQGFCNVFIYLRPRYEHFRRRYKDLTSWQIWAKIMHESFDNNIWCNNCKTGCCSSGYRTEHESPISTQPLSHVSLSKLPSDRKVVTTTAEEVNSDGNDQNRLDNDDEEEIDDDAIDDVNHNEDTEYDQNEEKRQNTSLRQLLIHQLSGRLSSPFGNMAFPRASSHDGGDVDGGDIISDQKEQRRDNNYIGTGCEESQQENSLHVQELYQQRSKTCEGEQEEKLSEDL